MTPTTPRAIALLAWIIASILPGALAIYKDDAGVLDFSVATAGHGAFEWARSVSDEDLLITTDVPRAGSRSSCFVAGRSLSTGALRWRRNVCSVPDPETQAHGIAMGASVSSSGAFYTVDNAGVVRAWTVADGDLLWDAKVAPSALFGGSKKPRVFAVDERTVAVASGESELVLLDASTGSLEDTMRVESTGGGGGVEFFSVTATSESSLSFAMARAAAGGDAFAGNDFLVGSYERGGKAKVGAGGLPGSARAVMTDSVSVIGDDVWAVTASGEVVRNGRVFPASSWVGDWDRVLAVKATTDPSVVALSGTSGGALAGEEQGATVELFRKDNTSSSSSSSSSQWKRIRTGEASASVYSPVGGWILATPPGQSARLFDATSGAPLPAAGAAFGADGDSVTIASVLEETATSSTVLIGTERGTTTVLEVSSSSSSSSSSSRDIRVLWTAEEGLSSISSAIILDASHIGSDDLVEEQDEVAYRLSLAGRWKAQWQELSEILTTANGLIGSSGKKYAYRDHLFGFLKVSALLSSEFHRLWGMSSAGDDRGAIRWSLDLPKTAVWHSMVHGTTNAARAAHGIHGDTHSREILVLSALPDRVEWMCIDGTSGAVNARDSVPLAAEGSSIAQVVPVYGPSTGGCRQAALLLGEDSSLTTVPGDGPTAALVQKHLRKTPNGLYTHKIDKVSSTVQSYRVASSSSSSSSGSLTALPVGMASFDGEQIVRVAYPLRHEDMQSMSTILGDNSLLLKYINPHMAVVVTIVKEPDQQSETEIARALGARSSSSGPRKPAGAGAPGSSTSPASASGLPNMFVNLVDTVSGRVLYRHGHSGVDTGKTVSVVVSENWVVYSYVNDKTRRTEIGVLTLHEGMIEPKGLTYFSRPEQSSSFSSFDSRESKPVVLSKVYAFPRAVTALGVTQTKQGISRQNILLASADGALITLNKMILETRRPVGDAKPDEKKEGLVPYRELIPNSPLISLNYNRTTEPFSSIVSATTALESQSLVFGFGGPDLFFARTSPTKGFDLLPETFNKGLVGMTTVGIVAALFAVQRMGEKKVLKQSWL